MENLPKRRPKLEPDLERQRTQLTRSNVESAVASAVTSAVTSLRRDHSGLFLGLSGGMDSVVLMHACVAVDLPLTAIHVHHGLSPHAESWLSFCTDLCTRLKVPLLTERVTVNCAARTSREEEARRARYVAYEQHVPSGGSLLLAHHVDDQAETILLQMLRGAGPAGWGGMAQAMPWRGRQLLRPFLGLPHVVLANYALSRQLKWIEDDSNADLRFKRNYLRHEVMPRLEKAFPAAAANLARAAAHAREAAQLAQTLARLDLQQVEYEKGLEIQPLLALGDARARSVLRCWLAKFGVRAPSQRRLAELMRQLSVSNRDTRLRWEHEGLVLLQTGIWLTVLPHAQRG